LHNNNNNNSNSIVTDLVVKGSLLFTVSKWSAQSGNAAANLRVNTNSSDFRVFTFQTQVKQARSEQGA